MKPVTLLLALFLVFGPMPSARAQGLNESVLRYLDSLIKRGQPQVHSVVVSKDGALAWERYYAGFGPEDTNNIKSCTKSVVSALIGLAIEDGFIRGTDDQLRRFYPEYGPWPRDKAGITIGHLLTMTQGFEWDENADTWPWMTSDDPIGYLIRKPLYAPPGTDWNYSSAATHLLSGVIARSTGMSTLEYAERRLFRPMGIERYQWEVMGEGGYHCGAGNLYLTPRDMARIGWMYLQGGMWEGRRILPEEWVNDTLTERNGGYPPKGSYGYLWWRKEINGLLTWFASGYGGQFIFLVPDLRMVIVVTSSWDRPSTDFPYEVAWRCIESAKR